MLTIKINNYERFFEVKGMPFLVASIFYHYYRNMNVFLINMNDEVSVYLDSNETKITRQNGYHIFSSSILFYLYKAGFDSVLNRADLDFQKLIKLTNIKISDRKKFFDLVGTFFKYYRKTEFFYTEKAYSIKTPSKKLLKNLELLGNLKSRGRVLLNKIFLGSDCYIEVFLQKLSLQNNISISTLRNLSFEEIVSGNFNVPTNFMKDYVLLYKNGKVLSSINDINIEYPDGYFNNNLVRGVVANKGVVRGYAKIIEPDYDNFDYIKIEIDSMKNGDILISESTSPELLLAFKKAAAVVTNQGGMGSHAAILSREFNIPCIVGTRNATKIINTGDYLLVDADNGIVEVLNRKQ